MAGINNYSNPFSKVLPVITIPFSQIIMTHAKNLHIFYFIFSIFCSEATAQNQVSEKEAEKQAYIMTDRPGIADTPFLIKKSAIQIESGFNYEFNTDHGRTNNALTYNSTLFRYGISKNFELRITSEYVKVTERHSLSDEAMRTKGVNALTLGSKIFITEEQNWIPAISFMATLNLPYFGNKELRPLYVAPGFKFMAQHSLTEKLSLSYNAGALWDGNKPISTGLYTFGLDYSLTEKATIFIENFGFVPESGHSQHGSNAGLCYLFTKNFQFDISAGFGLTDISSDGFINFGLSWRPSLNNLR